MFALLLAMLLPAFGAEDCSRLRLEVKPGYRVTSVAGLDVPTSEELVVEVPGGVSTVVYSLPGSVVRIPVRIAVSSGVEHQCTVDDRGLTCSQSVHMSSPSPEGTVERCSGRLAGPVIAPGALSPAARDAAQSVGLGWVAIPAAPSDVKPRRGEVVDVPKQIIPLHLLDQGNVGGRWYYDEHGHFLTKRQVISLLESDASSAQLMKERKTLLGVGAALTALTSVTGGLPMLVGGVICLDAGARRYDLALSTYNQVGVAVAMPPDGDGGRRGSNREVPDDELDADGDWVGLRDK